jgi:hypothetical protein
MKIRIVLSVVVATLMLATRFGQAQDTDAASEPPTVQAVETESMYMSAMPMLTPCGSDNFWSRYPGGYLWEGYCDEHLRCHGPHHGRGCRPVRSCGAVPCQGAAVSGQDGCSGGCTSGCASGCSGGCGRLGGISGRAAHGESAARCIPMRGCALCGISDLFHGLFHRRESAPAVSTCARPELDALGGPDSSAVYSPAAETGTGSSPADSDFDLPRNVIPRPTTRIQ